MFKSNPAMINQTRVERVIHLQILANKQIDLYGQVSDDVASELYDLVDNLTNDEMDEVIARFDSLTEDDLGGGMRDCGGNYYEPVGYETMAHKAYYSAHL